MQSPNFILKSLIIAKDGNYVNIARTLGMREDRLSRIVHRRVNPSDDEMKKLSEYLQKPVGEIFKN
jgi:hypothetical protein